MKVKVYLHQDIENVGMKGQIVDVSSGYATNFILPKKLGVLITAANEHQFKQIQRKEEIRKEVLASKTSMLAERIKSLKITVRRKTHDDGKLYGSLSPAEIAEALASEGVTVGKSQIITDKSIKEIGSYDVTVKLTSKLQPKFTLKVAALS